MSTRGLVEGAGIAEGRCGDLRPRGRLSELAQQARGLPVVRGENGRVGDDSTEQFGYEVEGPRVDDERRA